jgi:hypothetical protein
MDFLLLVWNIFIEILDLKSGALWILIILAIIRSTIFVLNLEEGTLRAHSMEELRGTLFEIIIALHLRRWRNLQIASSCGWSKIQKMLSIFTAKLAKVEQV